MPNPMSRIRTGELLLSDVTGGTGNSSALRGVSEIHSPSHQHVKPSAKNSTGMSKLHSMAIPLSFMMIRLGCSAVSENSGRIHCKAFKLIPCLFHAYSNVFSVMIVPKETAPSYRKEALHCYEEAYHTNRHTEG